MSRLSPHLSALLRSRTRSFTAAGAGPLLQWIGAAQPPATTRVDGIFEGGGALGAAYAGALRALSDQGIWFARVAGSSAGAIIAGMIAAGFNTREILWLMSNSSAHGAAPSSLRTIGITRPIDFNTFLDVSKVTQMSQASKRQTIIWHILNGTILDEIGKTPLPIPVQSQVVNDIVRDIKNVGPLAAALAVTGTENQLRGLLNATLAPLPNQQVRLRDVTLNTSQLRASIADIMWDAIGQACPLFLFFHNFLTEGGLFEGAAFLSQYSDLISRKVFGGQQPLPTPLPQARFSDLSIPLAVTGANITSGQLEIYSSALTPTMSVAEAVRRSMSVPFVFDPVKVRNGDLIVDGGVASNFPVWMFTPVGDHVWNPNSVDPNRPKIGFSLDDASAAPPAWSCDPAKWPLSGSPPRPDTFKIAVSLLLNRIADAYGVQLNQMPLGKTILDALLDMQTIVQIFKKVIGYPGSTLDRRLCTKAMMLPYQYFDIELPLLGFDWLDFDVNSDADDLSAMWDRGWHAVHEALRVKPNTGQPLLSGAVPTTPFN